jgi:hypothetical protein
MRQTTIGKVTERKGARWHLDIRGRAHCGAGRGVIAAATRWVADATIEVAKVCRRCIKALRAAVAETAAAGDVAGAGAAHMLMPPAEAAAYDRDLLADMRAFHDARTAARDAEHARIAANSWTHRERLLARLAAMPVPAGFEDYAA